VNAASSPVAENLHLIALSPPLPGFERFISVWLYRGRPSFLVDVGPASTVDNLFECLDQLEVTDLDYILLTHIHLDHAGAIGEVAAKFAGTPIVCQAAAIPHLIDPQRLWEGTKSVLGETALGYGPITAVAAERLVDAAVLSETAIAVIQTPGHAVHHVSYAVGDFLFAGEASGVWMDLKAGGEYLRPATPPRLYLDTAIASIEHLMASAPRWLCYSHFGIGDGARERLKRHHDQLLYWEQLIDRLGTHKDNAEHMVDECFKMLLAEDPLIKNFLSLLPAVQKREAYFMRNSIRGFLGWLKSKA
jgi:glyoxylase-like metal-dependent hydrolase (beta-lactamase superfamily II)